MEADRWARLAEILERVFDGPPERRAQIIESCDPALRADLDALLTADARAGSFMEGSATDLARRVGEIVGPYRLLSLIGSGGMADVFLAERADGQFSQRVAVKVVRRELATPLLVERFLRERQILAGLHHPGIAGLLDGGVSSRGEPYFAMEYVEGAAITLACADRGLGIPARLRLFLAICDGVQHAHRNLVVHLDLKPSNILVTPDDQVKLLDFGIARLLGTGMEQPSEGTLTRLGWRALTPQYAAPEQVVGGAVATTTDVYALGTILYELLTGRRVIEHDLGSPVEVERAVCGTEVPAPSAVAPRPDARRLRGDLDTIVARATAKAPDRRYPSVEALAADVRRHLEGLPIAARAESATYRMARFARRHRLGLSAAVLTMVGIVGGAGAALWQARLARQQSQRAQAVSEFVVGLFRQADPETARQRDVTARELVDRGARALDSRLNAEPALRIELLTLVGTIYQKLGAFESSKTVLDRAVASARRAGPSERSGLVDALSSLGITEKELRIFDAADASLREALTIRRQMYPPDDPHIARSLSDIGSVADERGRYEEAERLYREALDIDRRAYGESTLEVATDYDNLGVLEWRRGQLDEADRSYTRALAVRRAKLDATDPALLTTLGNLAVLRSAQSRFEEAIELQTDVLEARRKIYGNDHPDVALSLSNIAAVYISWGRYAEGQRFYQESLDIRRRVYGPDHSETMISLNGVAVAAFFHGDYETAAGAFEEVVERWRRQLGAEAPNTLTAESNLGAVLTELGRTAEGERYLRLALAGRRRTLGASHPAAAQTLRNLGVLLQRTGRLSEAEAALREALSIDTAALAPDHPRRAEVLTSLGSVLMAERRPADAVQLLRDAVAIRAAKLGSTNPDTWYSRGLLGAALVATHQPGQGASLLRDAYATLADLPGHRGQAVDLRSYLEPAPRPTSPRSRDR